MGCGSRPRACSPPTSPCGSLQGLAPARSPPVALVPVTLRPASRGGRSHRAARLGNRPRQPGARNQRPDARRRARHSNSTVRTAGTSFRARPPAPAPGTPLLLLMPSWTLARADALHSLGPRSWTIRPPAWRVPVCGVRAVNASSGTHPMDLRRRFVFQRKCRRHRRSNRPPQGSGDRFDARPARSPSPEDARSSQAKATRFGEWVSFGAASTSAEGLFDDVKQQIELSFGRVAEDALTTSTRRATRT